MPRIFLPGATVNIAVTTSAQNLTIGNAPNAGDESVRIANLGTQIVFINFNGTSTLNAIPILPGSAELFSTAGAGVISVIAAATGSTIYATIGNGT